MEFTIYLDSSLKNVQKVRTKDFNVKVKPRELAEACYPNYYAVSKNGGPLIKSSNRHTNSNKKE